MKKQVVVSLVSVVALTVAGVLVWASGGLAPRVPLSSAAYPRLTQDGSHKSLPDTLMAQNRQRIAAEYGRLPLSFEANRGQSDPRVKFVSRGQGYSLFLTDTEVVLALRRSDGSGHVRSPDSAPKTQAPGSEAGSGAASAVLRVKLAGANQAPRVEGLDQLPGRSNYFIGADPAKWRTDVPHYAKVRYRDVYPGVDLVYYGNQQRVEHDFIVAPGADPKQIRLAVKGANSLKLNPAGDLVLHVADAEVCLLKPTVYQEAGGVRTAIASRYTLTADKRVGFELGPYDATKSLVIDPVLEYSTYLSGNGAHPGGLDVQVDSDGSAYVVGFTTALNFPTVNPLQATHAGGPPNPGTLNLPGPWDVTVSKLSPDGSALVYSTYLGGSGDDRGYGIAVDSEGSAYVTGRTTSLDFPTKNPLQPTHGSGLWNAFVAKLNSEGDQLVYSTYLGGSGFAHGWRVAVDRRGSAYVTGWTNSADFPTKNSLQGFNESTCAGWSVPLMFGIAPGSPCLDAFVAKLTPDGSALVYSTFPGGSGDEDMRGSKIVVDAHGNAYVAGSTRSLDFPTTPNAPQRASLKTTYGTALTDGFVAKIKFDGSALEYATYLGGSGTDSATGIALDSKRNAYVSGSTNSPDFPITPRAFQTALSSGTCGARPCFDAFVTKLNRRGSEIVYSTFLGGSNDDQASGIAVDAAGNAYVAGTTQSTDFPTRNPLQPNFAGGGGDVFVTVLNRDARALVYSTYLGGSGLDGPNSIAVDSARNAYVTGNTRSRDFPTTANALQRAPGGGPGDAFVSKIAPTNEDEGDPDEEGRE